MSSVKESTTHYTEPGIRVITVFFAALVGFGLKHLADDGVGGVDESVLGAPNRFPDDFTCFCLAVLLFLRFLLGSANHLWYEHSRPGAIESRRNLAFDLAALTGYGLIAVTICYAKTLEEFLWRSVGLLIVACIWSGVDAFFFRRTQRRWWIGWLPINIIQGLFIALVIWKMTDMGVPSFGYAWWKLLLVVVYVGCLVADFFFQMKLMKLITTTRMIAPNGDKITHEDYGNGTTVLTHTNGDGITFSRTCQAECSGEKLGPIDCPRDKSPKLDLDGDPPTIECV